MAFSLSDGSTQLKLIVMALLLAGGVASGCDSGGGGGSADAMVADQVPPDAAAEIMVVDPSPQDIMVIDDVPPPVDTAMDAQPDTMVVDPLPPPDTYDPPPGDVLVVDMVPPDTTIDTPMPVDPLPPPDTYEDTTGKDTIMPVDPPPPPAEPQKPGKQDRPADQAAVMQGAPAFTPIRVEIRAEERDGAVLLTAWHNASKTAGPLDYKWDCTAGTIKAQGGRAVWIPPASGGRHLVQVSVKGARGLGLASRAVKS